MYGCTMYNVASAGCDSACSERNLRSVCCGLTRKFLPKREKILAETPRNSCKNFFAFLQEFLFLVAIYGCEVARSGCFHARKLQNEAIDIQKMRFCPPQWHNFLLEL